MKRIGVIIAILFVCVSPAKAENKWFVWDDANTALHVPLTVLMVVDMGQTLWIADNPDTHYERDNLVLDKYPSKGEVYTYFTASYILTTVIVYALPEKYSHAFQGGIISIEAYAINNNYHLGIGVKF